MTIYENVLQDLKNSEPVLVMPFIPMVNTNGTAKEKIKSLYRQLLRAKRLGNRKEMLTYAWYIGQNIESQNDSPPERTVCLNLLTKYYQVAIIRTYYLFKFIRVE